MKRGRFLPRLAFLFIAFIATPSSAQSEEFEEAFEQAASDPAAQLVSGVWFQNLPEEVPMLAPEVFFALNPDVVLPVSEGVTGDFDGDGVQDMLLPGVASNEPGAETQGRLIAWSGWTGDLLFHVINTETGDLFGSSFAHVGDLSGDGGDEIVVGAPLSSAGAAQAGKAYIVNGADGRLLYTITSDVAGANANFQAAVAGPKALFNAANDVHFPPLQSTCAAVEAERQQALEDLETRMMELFEQCVDDLEESP